MQIEIKWTKRRIRNKKDEGEEEKKCPFFLNSFHNNWLIICCCFLYQTSAIYCACVPICPFILAYHT